MSAQERAASGDSTACSRERSRNARAVLDEFFYPVTDGAGYTLDSNCPVSRLRDMYYEHERHKEPVRYSKHYWKSLYSDKVFKSEYYVDKHMERRHMDKIPAEADVCLAELCDVLQCSRHAAYLKREQKKFPWCDKKYMAGIQNKCERLLSECFPDNGVNDKATRLHSYFQKYYCQQMSCEGADGVFQLMSAHHERPSVGYYIALVFLVMLLLAYYLSIYSWTSARKKSLDIKSTRSSARSSKLSLENLQMMLMKSFRGHRKRKTF